jgi:hypothetical protein
MTEQSTPESVPTVTADERAQRRSNFYNRHEVLLIIGVVVCWVVALWATGATRATPLTTQIWLVVGIMAVYDVVLMAYKWVQGKWPAWWRLALMLFLLDAVLAAVAFVG